MNKEIIINIEPQERRVAVLENKILEEFFVERTGQPKIVGNIYKAKVSSVIQGIGAAFLDLGLDKNGFLYVSDIIEDVTDFEDLTSLEDMANHSRPSQAPNQNIHELLKKGQEILVQVVKEPFGTKGARLTTHLSLAGRYIVLMPQDAHVGVSRKIDDENERDRLRKILKEIRLPSRMGFIIRTAGAGRSKKDFIRDIKYLLKVWNNIKYKAKKSKAPVLIHQEYDLILRIARDYFTDSVQKLVIDAKEQYKQIYRFVANISPHLKQRIEFYHKEVPLFEHKGIYKEISKIYQRKVYLKSGGYIVIEPTESLVTIDVNSGKYVGKKNLEDTAFSINTEAAREIARQIRLRDLGGIIIIDFIDMGVSKNRQRVLEALKRAIKPDRAKTNILPLSPIGLIEMTRQRIRGSLESMYYQVCPYCQGRGSVKSIATMSIETQRLIKQHLGQKKPTQVRARVHPLVAQRLLSVDKNLILQLERQFRSRISIQEDSSLQIDDIRME